MISVEQIKHLESKVHSAVERIRMLAAENSTLKERLGDYELRINEFQRVIDAFKVEQAEIESGIVSALRQLDELEDTVDEPSPDAAVQRDEPVAVSADHPRDERPPEAASVDVPSADAPATSPAADADGQDDADDPEDSSDDAENDDGAEESPELDIF